jgi:2-polyprenyl-6-methoxyphenol hydroxylase-like FAD-dependent oxidoreductase
MTSYDAIVVGARCAGASTAMLLARSGHKVLLLDRDEFPSDMVASTHMVWLAGVARLKSWGLLDKLKATGCPPMAKFNLDLGEFVLSAGAPPAGDVTQSYAPRRYVLDSMLVDAAVEAGAELRRGSVVGLLTEGDRAVGVRYSDHTGPMVEERARLVIGADGTNSSIARFTGAPAYDETSQLQGTYYAYFADLPLDSMEFYSRPGRMIYAWSTNDGMTVAGICCRYEDYRRLNDDPERNFYAEAEVLTPEFCERVRAARRGSAWLKGATRNIRRKAFGPGWALVGDAGLTVDPISAAGIANAFRDAEYLAEAAHQGLSGALPLDEAMAQFQDRRDASAVPIYEFTREMAKLDPPPQEVIDLFVALRDNPKDTSDYFGIFAQTVSPAAFFAADNVRRIIASGATVSTI